MDEWDWEREAGRFCSFYLCYLNLMFTYDNNLMFIDILSILLIYAFINAFDTLFI